MAIDLGEDGIGILIDAVQFDDKQLRPVIASAWSRVAIQFS